LTSLILVNRETLLQARLLSVTLYAVIFSLASVQVQSGGVAILRWFLACLQASEMPLNDNVDNTSSDQDDKDNATFVLSVRREHTRVSKHDRTNEDTLVTTPQQRTETARKMQLMRRELATTNTFVQQMDYKA